MVWLYFSSSLTSYITNICAVSSVNQYVISLVTHFVVRWSLWMSLHWYQVPIAAKSLPNTKFTFRFPLSLVLLGTLCPPHARYRRTLFQLQCWNLLVLFSCCNWELCHTLSPENYKILWLFHLFIQLECVLISVSNCNI